MNRWWRAYSAARHDPKVQRLPGEMFKAWFNLICLASDHDGLLPPLSDTAYELHKPQGATKKLLADFIERGLFDETETGITPHNWNARQYKSDVSTERVKHHRERRRNVSLAVSETPSENRLQKQTQRTDDLTTTPSVTNNGHTHKRAGLIDIDWQPSEADVAALRKARPDLVGSIYDQRMQDFRNWCRSAAVTSHHAPSTWDSFMRKTRAVREGAGSESYSDRRAREAQEAIERSKMQ